MIELFKKVLVLAPHTDDGELGAGGMIAKLVESRVDVHYMAFSIAEESVPGGLPKDILKVEVQKATEKLGILNDNLIIKNYTVRKFNYARQDILEDLIEVRRNHKFDLILMPSPKDVHQDHQVISNEGIRAFKNTSILGYELIWNNLSFDSTCFVTLKEKHVQAKCNALYEYGSQRGRPYMSEDFIFSLAKTRGVQAGVEYAECYEVVRWVIN